MATVIIDVTRFVIAAHSFVGAEVVIPVKVDGFEHSIQGVATGVRPLSDSQIIELLRKDSTPGNLIINKFAAEMFQEAAQWLVRYHKSFYTVTRLDWRDPIVRWRLPSH